MATNPDPVVTLIKEDGFCVTGANSYASAADATDYHAGHLYRSAWVNASATDRDRALVMATRLLDANLDFLGLKKTAGQKLAWPRIEVPDLELGDGCFVPINTVPPGVVKATCEMAREFLICNRTGAPLGEGLTQSSVAGAMFTYDKFDRAPVITKTAKAFVRWLVRGWAGGSMATLVRV